MTAAFPRVALVLVAVGDLSGSGGTERQFSDLFDHLRRLHPGSVALVTTRHALRRLQATGRVADGNDVVTLPAGDGISGTFAIAWLTLTLLWATLTHRWDVVHLCQPTPIYLPYAAVITRLPRWMRPRIALTVVDCTLAHRLLDPRGGDLYERQVEQAHRWYFRWARLDGIYSWYQAFIDAARTTRLLPARAAVIAAKYCFTDTARFTPAAVKEPLVIFAGRLSEQKRPLLFVDAIAKLIERHPDAAAGWRFEIYGRGVLEGAVKARIAEHRLERVITMTHVLDMAPVFARSQVFVSTQAYENFTSLAMLEAMAAGNAIVAEAVGQTAEFVQHGRNGFAVAATPEAFADAIADYIRHPERHAEMAGHSRALATGVHTIENFSNHIAAFWAAVTQR